MTESYKDTTSISSQLFCQLAMVDQTVLWQCCDGVRTLSPWIMIAEMLAGSFLTKNRGGDLLGFIVE